MKITTKSKNAIQLMIDLGLQGESYVRLKDIAKRQKISIKYLEQIVNSLQKNRLLLSSRGAQGGYKLAKSIKEYTLGDIIRAADGYHALEDKNIEKQESIEEIWGRLNRMIDEYLDSITLEDLIEIEKNKQEEALEYYI